jgi:hypothetical protein
MVVQELDAARELQNAVHVLADRWKLALPTAIGSLVIGAIVFFVIGAVAISAVAAALIGSTGGVIAAIEAGATSIALGVGAAVLVATIAHAMVLAAARDAWAGRDPDFRAAIHLTTERFPALIVLAFLTALIYAIPVALSVVLIGIPLLIVAGYLLMYARAAIVIGGEDPFAAIATSYRIATTHAKPSIIAFLGIIAAFIVGRMVDATTIHIPGIGLVTAFFVGGATAAYIALIEVRFYALLRDAPPASRTTNLTPRA